MKTPGQIACEEFNGGPIDTPWGTHPDIEAAWERAAKAVMKIEREACAKVCEVMANTGGIGGWSMATAIRTRSNAEITGRTMAQKEARDA